MQTTNRDEYPLQDKVLGSPRRRTGEGRDAPNAAGATPSVEKYLVERDARQRRPQAGPQVRRNGGANALGNLRPV